MKRAFKITISVLFVVTIIGMIVYVNLHPDKNSLTTNIFDEIYSEVRMTYTSNNTLRKMPDFDISSTWPVDSDAYKYTPFGNYETSTLPTGYSKIEIAFNFRQKEQTLFLEYKKSITDDLRIWCSNKYSFKDKTLTKEVFIQKRKEPSSDYFETIENKKAIKRYLDQYHITAKDLNTYYDQIVNKKILTDWCSVYDSKFSPGNYGKVKIKTQWENW